MTFAMEAMVAAVDRTLEISELATQRAMLEAKMKTELPGSECTCMTQLKKEP